MPGCFFESPHLSDPEFIWRYQFIPRALIRFIWNNSDNTEILLTGPSYLMGDTASTALKRFMAAKTLLGYLFRPNEPL